MKKVLLTTPHQPYDVAWGEDTMDLLASRLARGHGANNNRSELPTWALYLIAENIESPATVLEYPRWEDFRYELARGYDVIGIQLKTINNERAARMIEAIRRYSPGSEIVLGGYGVGALDFELPGDVHGYSAYIKSHVHHLCREEGVRFMRRLLGESRVDRPITQYHLPYARYRIAGMRAFDLQIPAVLVALGCPSGCEFCNTSAFFKHQKIFIAEPAETVDFIRHHVGRLGRGVMNVILFNEDIFLEPEYVRELGRLLRADRRLWDVRWISFGSMKAVSQMDPEEIRACGCGAIWIGVESGIREGGQSKTGYAKREGCKEPPELFDDLRRYGIETIGSTILGFDFHTPENITEDIDYFVKLRPTFYQVSPLTPCPGTKLFQQLTDQGRLFPHYDHSHFHLWKDDVYELPHFPPGAIKQYFDLAHERLRTVNGPPVMQFCEANLLAYETMRGSQNEYLRHQAELARRLGLGALPIVRTIGKRPPSPAVLERVRELEALARRTVGRGSLGGTLAGRALELVASVRADLLDPLDRPPVTSEPPVVWMDYNQPGKRAPVVRSAWREHRRAARRAVAPPSTGPLGSLTSSTARVERPRVDRLRVLVDGPGEAEPETATARAVAQAAR